jgi:hypothetical protein
LARAVVVIDCDPARGADAAFEIAENAEHLVGADVDAEHEAGVGAEPVAAGGAADAAALGRELDGPAVRDQLGDGGLDGGARPPGPGRELAHRMRAGLAQLGEHGGGVEPAQQGLIAGCERGVAHDSWLDIFMAARAAI